MKSFLKFKSSVIIPLFLGLIIFTCYSCKKSELEQIINPGSTITIIDNIAPNSGLAGTEVTITGTNFSTVLAENSVKFNGIDAVVKSATSTKLVVTAPQSGTSGNITLKVKSGNLATGPTFAFGAYPTLTSVNPTNARAGDQVTITGTNFSVVKAENRVTFTTSTTNSEAVIISATATQLVVEVPAAAITGNIGVITNNFSSTNNLQITITATNVGSNISLFLEQSQSGVDKFASDLNGNVYATFNGGPFNVRGSDGTIKKTFTKADFNNHPGVIIGFGKDTHGNVCVAWNRYSGSKSWTTFFRIKPDFTSELIGIEVYPLGGLGAIQIIGLFAVDKNNDIYYTDHYSIYKVENSTIDLTKRYIDGRNYPVNPYTLDFVMDVNSNLYVLTSKPISTGSSTNTQEIVKYDINKNRTTLYTFETITTDRTKYDPIPSSTIGQFRAILRSNDNSIYLGDYDGNRIRKVTGNNKTEIIAGSGEYIRGFQTFELTGPKLTTPVPHPLYLDYDTKTNRIFSKPDGYNNGIFLQVFGL